MIATVLLTLVINLAILLFISLKSIKLLLRKLKNNRHRIKAGVLKRYEQLIEQGKRFETWFNKYCEDQEVSSDEEATIQEEANEVKPKPNAN